MSFAKNGVLMAKIAFLGSKEIGYQCLRFLIEKSQEFNITIVGVISNDRKLQDFDKSVIDLAKTNNLPLLNTQDDLLSVPQIDYIISVQHHQIMQSKHINCAKILAINLHMAPLPEYRGCNQFSFGIIDKVKEFGATIHVLETGIDSGDILFESRFPIAKNETAISLYEKTLEKSITLFKSNILSLFTGNYIRKPQSEFYSERSRGYHERKEINQLKEIDFSWEDEKIDRYIRATYFPPFSPPFTKIEGKKIELSLNWKKELNR